MRVLLRSVMGLSFVLVSVPVMSQQYRAGPGASATFRPGFWDGKYRRPNVYCLTFPRPKEAMSLEERPFNDNHILMVRVEYSAALMANVVISSIPSGRSPEEEVRKLLEGEKYAEAAYKTTYNITETTTRFGPTIGLRIRDVAPAGREGPFPLVRPLLPAGAAIQSMSVHRLFVRGPDRFEVAVYQFAPTVTTDSTESEMAADLTRLADGIVDSLQKCTAEMPVRSE